MSDWFDATATYLGDGAYAHFDGYHVVLTANHGQPELATDTVKLDPEAMLAFLKWIQASGGLSFGREE